MTYEMVEKLNQISTSIGYLSKMTDAAVIEELQSMFRETVAIMHALHNQNNRLTTELKVVSDMARERSNAVNGRVDSIIVNLEADRNDRDRLVPQSAVTDHGVLNQYNISASAAAAGSV